MPRSKRNKVVSLTKTGAKGKDLKNKLVETLRDAVDHYSSVYILNFENLRPSLFREIRMDWKESKIFMGKNKIAQVAFGRTPEEEYKDNLCSISKRLEGGKGILFTNREREEVERYFSSFNRHDFAKAGTIPNESVVLKPGVLEFPVSMLDELRRLGLVVEIDDGTVVLRTPFTAATAGEPLTPEQAKVLVKLDKRMVDFTISLECAWTEGDFKEYH